MEEENVLKIVGEINSELWEKINSTDPTKNEDYDYPNLNFESDGTCELVKFMDIIIWCSENDEREFIEDNNAHEPLEPFLKKEMRKLVEKANKVIQ